MMGRLLTTLTICSLCGSLSAQTTYYVSNVTGSDASSGTSPNNPKQTIQAAIVAAASGDSISIAATAKVYAEMVQLSGKTLMFISSAGIPELSRLTVDQPSLSYELDLINSFRVDSLVLRNGLIYTRMNSSIILPSGSQGFDRSGVVGSNISHIVGQVARRVLAGRNEFPVGTATYYRPLVLTFNVNPGGMVKVRHIDTRPTGTVGLPITDAIQPGVDVARYAPFCWSVMTDSGISSAILYHLELTAAGFSDFDYRDLHAVGVIRRSGSASDTTQPWMNQGGGVDNYVVGGVLTTKRWNSVGGLSSDGTIFTYGFATKLVVANPFPIIFSHPLLVFKHSLLHPPLFVGNEGPLRFGVSVKDTTIAKAEILQDDTLVVIAKKGGWTSLTISGSDTAGNKAIYATSVADSIIADCFSSPLDGRPVLNVRNIAFRNIEMGKFRDTTFTVSNYGCYVFSVTITTSNNNFSVVPSRTSVGYESNITLRFAPWSTGQVRAVILISSDYPLLYPPDTITVSGIGDPTTLVDQKSETPLDCSLSQNFPNPFNPSTTISYELPMRAVVTLTIFNVLGQKVATLMNGDVDAGRRQITWNAEGLPSGVYFYHLQSGSFSETKKLILLR